MRGIFNVCVYIDDILVTGGLDPESLRKLDEVLAQLASAGLKLKVAKCSFMQASVEHPGHKISADGLQPMQEKIRAIVETPPIRI